MKRYALAATLLACGNMAVAQESGSHPVVEVGLNYTFAHIDPGHQTPSFDANGGGGSFEYNVNKVVGVVADLGAFHNGDPVHLSTTTFNYLFGPRFNLRLSKFTPYFQALAGGVRVSSGLIPESGPADRNAFATEFGGGLDIGLTRHITFKPFEVDYLMTQVSNLWNVAGVQNDFRYSAGVAFRFGSK